MALINRLARLFRADFHAVLDRIEEPEVLLRQAVREMEEELARDERRLAIVHQEQEQLGARESDLEQTLREIEGQLDVCFDAGKDDLARALIGRRLETQRLCKFIARKRATLQATTNGLKTRIDDQRPRLEQMRQQAAMLVGEDSPVAVEDGGTVPDTSISDADVEVAFLREQRKRRPS